MRKFSIGQDVIPEHGWFESDEKFDQVYPEDIRLLTKRHWTPLRIAKRSAGFLAAAPGDRVLDIGSGVGKFCLAAAYYQPGVNFCGVEQRPRLVAHAERARQALGLTNIHFFPTNMLQLNFRHFNHFYFYNSFYENLFDEGLIDNSVRADPGLYSYYTRFLNRKLGQMPKGTRLVTFHSLEGTLPCGYELCEQSEDSLLKFWIRI